MDSLGFPGQKNRSNRDMLAFEGETLKLICNESCHIDCNQLPFYGSINT